MQKDETMVLEQRHGRTVELLELATKGKVTNGDVIDVVALGDGNNNGDVVLGEGE